MKTTDRQQSFNTGAIRDTADNKPRPELISPYFINALGNWLSKGANKYEDRNWEKGIPISRCVASLLRHTMSFMMGLTDEDHEAAIACNIMFILHYRELIAKGKLPAELDDMPHYENLNYSPNKQGEKKNVTKKHKNNARENIRKK